MNARAQQALLQGAPGFLYRDMTRYSHGSEQPFSVMVGAREPAGQRPAILDQGYRSGRRSMVGAGVRKTPGHEALYTASVAKPGPKPRAEVRTRTCCGQPHSDLDLTPLPWYQALALWKASIFSEAIYTRWLNGERPHDTTIGRRCRSACPT
jgi:hypothetical protein